MSDNNVVQEVSLSDVYSLVLETFEDNQVAADWMEEAQTLLGGLRPVDVCSTPDGRYHVWVALNRIQNGTLT